MTETPSIHLAMDLHRAGRLAAAKQIYLQVLADHPAEPDALHLLGVLAHDEKDYDRAIDLIQKGIEQDPGQAPFHHNLGNALLAKGDLLGAGKAYGRAVKLRPDYGEARFGLGNVFFHQQKYQQAILSFRRCLEIMPVLVNAWFNLGKTYRRIKEVEPARRCFQKVLTLAPNHTEALQELVDLNAEMGWFEAAIACQRKLVAIDSTAWQPLVNLADLLAKNGAFQAAIDAYQQALQIDPHCSAAYHYLANLLTETGQLDLALDLYRQGHARKALGVETLYNFAHTLCRVGAWEAAIPLYQQALKQQPDSDRILKGLGNAHRQAGCFETAADCFQKVLKINPTNGVTHYYLGQVHQAQGAVAACKKDFAAALQHNPELTAAKWSHHLALPVLYADPKEICRYRREFSKGLDALIAQTPLVTIRQREAAFSAACRHTNFYLTYQGMNDLALQRKYGALVSRIVNSRFPGLSITKPGTTPGPMGAPGRRIKVGFVSAHFYAHTVAYLFEGWIRELNRDDFDVIGYLLDQIRDPVSRRIKAAVGLCREFDGDFEKFARRIRSDQPDVLIYPEIGMHPMSICFAALRLAPVQCVSWGHPVTTGLPSMDYFLSSESMEPENGGDHYSETLILLPNLSVYVEPPVIPAQPKSRAHFGLDPEAFVYLSCQSLFKYLPQYDRLFAQIAMGVPEARLVFIDHPSDVVTRRFKLRLAQTFADLQLDSGRICLFLPRMDTNDFLSLNLTCDAVLDPPAWSGGKTALESLYCGKPVVTLPGAFMRGRHTSAMLKQIGVAETIADDADRYVAIARQLAAHPGFFSAVTAKVKAGRHLLFKDQTVVNALEDFLKSVVRGGKE